MPKKSIISEGNTTNEAIENGLKILKVSRNMVNINVLEEDKRSFFSILAPRVVKVELTLKEDENTASKKQNNDNKVNVKREPVSPEKLEIAEKNVKVFLDEFLSKIGSEANYNIKKDEYGLLVEIQGQDLGILIGYRGETLNSLQVIISAIASKNCDERIRVILDIENYKQKREKTLSDLALKIASTVEKTGKSKTLEPMMAYERKIIHSTLQDSSKVKTESIGEEPRRRVVISLKK